MLMRLAWVARFADIFKSGTPKCGGILQICVISLFQNQAEILSFFPGFCLVVCIAELLVNADILERFH